ncbi:MAG: hypothetical protein WC836_23885 [Desulfobacula sp.]|jgi:hypothetical protein
MSKGICGLSNNKIEGIGLILVLFAFGWQLLENDLANLANDVDLYQTHKKIDAIWFVLSDSYTHSPTKNTAAVSIAEYDTLNNSWQGWEDMKKEKNSVSSKKIIILMVRSVIYLLGSILIIYSKFRVNPEPKITSILT